MEEVEEEEEVLEVKEEFIYYITIHKYQRKKC